MSVGKVYEGRLEQREDWRRLMVKVATEQAKVGKVQ